MKPLRDFFVPLSMAIRLRELGFNEPCLASFVPTDACGEYTFRFCCGPIQYRPGGMYTECADTPLHDTCILIPMYEQVLDWLAVYHPMALGAEQTRAQEQTLTAQVQTLESVRKREELILRLEGILQTLPPQADPHPMRVGYHLNPNSYHLLPFVYGSALPVCTQSGSLVEQITVDEQDKDYPLRVRLYFHQTTFAATREGYLFPDGRPCMLNLCHYQLKEPLDGECAFVSRLTEAFIQACAPLLPTLTANIDHLTTKAVEGWLDELRSQPTHPTTFYGLHAHLRKALLEALCLGLHHASVSDPHTSVQNSEGSPVSRK